MNEHCAVIVNSMVFIFWLFRVLSFICIKINHLMMDAHHDSTDMDFLQIVKPENLVAEILRDKAAKVEYIDLGEY